MIDAEIANQLAGPMGGIFGLGLIMGAVLMFAANRKVVEPYMQRAHVAEIQVRRIIAPTLTGIDCV